MNILVTEDNYMLGEMMRVQLEAMGHTVVGPVPRISEALAALAYYSVDFGILDINMGVEGFVTPVADALEERGIPFIFVTGYSVTYARGMPLGKRFRDHRIVTKPYRMDDLRMAIENPLGENGNNHSSSTN